MPLTWWNNSDHNLFLYINLDLTSIYLSISCLIRSLFCLSISYKWYHVPANCIIIYSAANSQVAWWLLRKHLCEDRMAGCVRMVIRHFLPCRQVQGAAHGTVHNKQIIFQTNCKFSTFIKEENFHSCQISLIWNWIRDISNWQILCATNIL